MKTRCSRTCVWSFSEEIAWTGAISSYSNVPVGRRRVLACILEQRNARRSIWNGMSMSPCHGPGCYRLGAACQTGLSCCSTMTVAPCRTAKSANLSYRAAISRWDIGVIPT